MNDTYISALPSGPEWIAQPLQQHMSDGAMGLTDAPAPPSPSPSTADTSSAPQSVQDKMATFDFNAISEGVVSGSNLRPGKPDVKPQSPATPSPQSTPVAEIAAEVAPEDERQVEPDADDELAAVDQNAPKIELRQNRWKEVYANHKAFKEISDFAPSVADARAHFEAASQLDQMHSDFTSSDPQAVGGFLKYWAGASPQGFAAMAQQLPETLKATSPEAYEALQSHVLNDVIENNYQAAQASGDPQAMYNAQMFEYTQTGKYRQPTEIKQPDPLADREAKVIAREQAIEAQAKQEQQAKVQQWTQSTYGTIAQTIDQETSTILGEAAKHYPKPVLQMLTSEIRKQVASKISQDVVWTNNFNLKFGQGQKQMNPEAQAALKDLYMQKARTMIRAVAKPLVSAATTTVVQANTVQHEKSKAAAAQAAPTGGKPVNPGARTAVRPGASLEDKINAHFSPVGQ